MYPPEPEIIYGAFDASNYYAPIRPGHAGDVKVGFGINNLPPNVWGVVAPDAENPTLRDYLNDAKRAWEVSCKAKDFEAVENPLEFLIGARLGRTWLYSDQFGSEVTLPNHETRSQITFNYGTDCVVTGLMSPEEITEHIHDARYSGDGPATVLNVEGDKITLSTGAVFHLTSRYRFDIKPKAEVRNNAYRALFIDNLVSMRERRDSTLEAA